jgi:hypothetical protein
MLFTLLKRKILSKVKIEGKKEGDKLNINKNSYINHIFILIM